MAAAALIIGIVCFNIKIVRASTAGIEFENVTIKVILSALVILLIYHAIAFFIHAYEEYRNWELSLVTQQSTFYGGGIGVIDLASMMKKALPALEKVIKSSEATGAKDQTVLTTDDAKNLREASRAALTYGKRLKNFPKITRIKFWVWDIGVALGTTLIALWLFGHRLAQCAVVRRVSDQAPHTR